MFLLVCTSTEVSTCPKFGLSNPTQHLVGSHIGIRMDLLVHIMVNSFIAQAIWIVLFHQGLLHRILVSVPKAKLQAFLLDLTVFARKDDRHRSFRHIVRTAHCVTQCVTRLPDCLDSSRTSVKQKGFGENMRLPHEHASRGSWKGSMRACNADGKHLFHGVQSLALQALVGCQRVRVVLPAGMWVLPSVWGRGSAGSRKRK